MRGDRAGNRADSRSCWVAACDEPLWAQGEQDMAEHDSHIRWSEVPEIFGFQRYRRFLHCHQVWHVDPRAADRAAWDSRNVPTYHDDRRFEHASTPAPFNDRRATDIRAPHSRPSQTLGFSAHLDTPPQLAAPIR